MTYRWRAPCHRVPESWLRVELTLDAPVADQVAATAAALAERLRGHAPCPYERGDFLLLGGGAGPGLRTDGAALALAAAGVGGLLADTVHDAFRASCLHAGIPVLALPGLSGLLREGDDLIVDFGRGTLENVRTHRMVIAPALAAADVALVRQAPARQWYRLVTQEPPRAEPSSDGPAPPVPGGPADAA